MDVVGDLAWLASSDREVAVGVSSWHVGGKIEVKELVVERSRRGCQTPVRSRRLVWAGPVEGELGLEHDGVGAFIITLARGVGGVVAPPNHR